MTARLTRTEPRTDPELLALIEKARNYVMTPEEVEAQRISWVIGQIGLMEGETRESAEARVREVLRLPPAGEQRHQATPRWQHIKSGGTYAEIGRGRMQTTDPAPDMAEVVIYRSEKDGSLWARPVAEFDDGRFVALSPSQAAANMERWPAWCQPGDQQAERHFLVTFDDPDCSPKVFTDEAQARCYWHRMSRKFNCWLFGALSTAGDPAAAEVARLREWCSAAADDLDRLLAKMKAGVGTRFDDIFRRTAEDFADTSAFLRAAAEGRADGTLYEAELTKAKNERDAARAAVVQMREDCARAAERFAPATSGPDYGMASDAERREAREAERLAYAIADAIRVLPTAPRIKSGAGIAEGTLP